MLVYRICLAKWSKQLTASGFPARWNSKGKYVLYTASTTALACLENVVHRNGEGLNANFKLMTIEISSRLKIKRLKKSETPQNWYTIEAYSDCQKIGDQWVDASKFAVLQVPSSIIKNEHNFLINVNHKDMKLINLKKIEDFEFDPRIKSDDP